MIDDFDALRRQEQRLLTDVARALDLPVLGIDYEAYAHSSLRRPQYGWFLRLRDGSERFLANGLNEALAKLTDPGAQSRPGKNFDQQADALLYRLGFTPKVSGGER